MAALDCNRNPFPRDGDDAVTASLQISPANSLWENIMLKSNSSQNADRVARLYDAGNGEAGNVLSDSRGVACGSRNLNSRPAAMPAVTESDRPNPALWWSVFNCFMEGFAIYGASVHPAAAFPVEAVLKTGKGLEPGSATREQATIEHDTFVLSENRDVVELGRVPASDACRSSRWHWLTSLCQPVGTLWTYWRREQQLRNAVTALAELDDRTLRDIGIPHRSQIEQAVRYCRDC